MQTLVVQRGHVPRKTGMTGTAGEQDVVTRIAAAMRPAPAGWRLVVIDADVDAALYRGDAFVALHCDGSSNRSKSGASVGYKTPEGKALAARWKAAYVAQGWSRGFRSDNYTAGLSGYYGYKHALAQGTKACIVVEHGFLTNAGDAAWIRANIDKCAAAVWAAVAGTEEAQMYYIYGVVVDLGDPAHRSALRAIAAKYNDKLVEGTIAVAYHAALGENADAYIAYTSAHGLEHHSDTNGEASRMVLRSAGTVPSGDNGRLADYEARFDRIAALLAQAQSEIPK